MRTIVFIGTNKSGSSREAIRAAQRLGFFTVLITNRKQFLENRSEFPDVHQMLYANFKDMDALREQIALVEQQGNVIDAIVSYIDSVVHTAAILAQEQGINRISTNAVRLMEDKILTRRALQQTPHSPYFAVCMTRESLTVFVDEQSKHLPLIVKSPISSGSKDVIRADTADQLRKYILDLRHRYPNEPVLVEEYLSGPQYLVEVLVDSSVIHLVAVLEQEVEEKKRFIVTGYALLAKEPEEFMVRLREAVTNIVNELGMMTGTCHLEMRLVNDEWKLVEINPRISGGAMNRMIEVAYGVNLVEETLKLQLGMTPNLHRQQEQHVFTQYITVSDYGYLQKVTGKAIAQSYPGVQEVYVKPKKEALLTPPWSLGQRYAYVLAAADTKHAARDIAKRAAQEIHFHLIS